MLLRRVTQHVKDQNWFAVGLDFLIVVVGVFIGLQVSNWNDGRTERAQEQKYLMRLQADVRSSLEETSAKFSFQTNVRRNLDEAVAAFGKESSVQDLSTDQCVAIYFSHIYDDMFLPQPAVTELFASGQMSILRDDRLREVLATHAQALEGWDDEVDGIQADRVVMSSRYPDLIELGVELSKFSFVETAYGSDELADSAQCNLAEMRLNTGFKNDLIDNSSRHSAYFRTLAQQQDYLARIQAELDRIGPAARHEEGSS